MASVDVENALKAAAQKLTALLTDAAELTVTTNYIVVGQNGNPERSASTTFQVDGDVTVAVPVTKDGKGELVAQDFLFKIHQENVKVATEYRARIVAALVEALGKVV
jgi:hypothetical protein